MQYIPYLITELLGDKLHDGINKNMDNVNKIYK